MALICEKWLWMVTCLLYTSPFLASMKGETLITTDGTTLLGADDKAGVAEIMTAVETVLERCV